MLFNRINKFTNKNYHQFGYVEGSNTLSATSELLHFVRENVDDGKYIVVLFVEKKGLFMHIDNEIFLTKLASLLHEIEV